MPASVWVAYRIGEDSCLTVGVFVSPIDARAYIDRVEPLPVSRWAAPRPGRQYWSSITGAYEYRVEAQPLRPSASLLIPEEEQGDLVLVPSVAYETSDQRAVAD